jgi:hypothetical protein
MERQFTIMSTTKMSAKRLLSAHVRPPLHRHQPPRPRQLGVKLSQDVKRQTLQREQQLRLAPFPRTAFKSEKAARENGAWCTRKILTTFPISWQSDLQLKT